MDANQHTGAGRCGQRPAQPAAVAATGRGLAVRREGRERVVGDLDAALAALA
jgi:hypothetical protein